MTVTVAITGLDRATVAIQHITMWEFDELLTILGKLILAQTERHFEDEAGPTGAWAPWRPSTASRRKGGQILTETGQLRGSFSMKTGLLDVEVGTNVPYGKFHQWGTKKMVARPFVGLSETDKDEVEQAIETYLTSLM